MRKRRRFFFVVITVVFCMNIQAQESPFIFTAYGGLFFPSNIRFTQIAESKSDLIWGGGVSLPIASALFATGDWSSFISKAMVNPAIDSNVTLEQQFFHLGILSKRRLFEGVLLRLSGGLSYSVIKEKYSSNRTQGRDVKGDNKLGYFGGIGIEQPLDVENHLSIFTDVIYDYRRSERKELFGDFGGLRIVVGMHLFVF